MVERSGYAFPYKSLLPFRRQKVDVITTTATTEATATTSKTSTVTATTATTVTETTHKATENADKKRLSLESQVIFLSPTNSNGYGDHMTRIYNIYAFYILQIYMFFI